MYVIGQDMMDRDKKDQLPKMQVGFIDAICTPVYEVCVSCSVYLQTVYLCTCTELKLKHKIKAKIKSKTLR